MLCIGDGSCESLRIAESSVEVGEYIRFEGAESQGQLISQKWRKLGKAGLSLSKRGHQHPAGLLARLSLLKIFRPSVNL